jgi:hypothetical protein
MYVDGVDQGYMEDRYWWFRGKNAFRIAKLDHDYPDDYFKEDHISEQVADVIAKNISEYFFKITNTKLISAIEFGCGGGWTVNALNNVGVKTMGLDGSTSGIKKCRTRYGFENFMKLDIRYAFHKDEMYQIAICTEVAEHIEIPFHATLVHNLINCADMIWFSSEGPEIDNKPHLHHCAEMPLDYWVKLFDFFGYGFHPLPDEVYNACQQRGRCIFFNRHVYGI